jgi:hypothetical protein
MRSPFGILTDYQKQSLGKKSGNKKLGKKVWHFYSEFSMTALPGLVKGNKLTTPVK